MNRVLIFILFFLTQISIVAFIAVRASKSGDMVLVCDSAITGPAGTASPSHQVLKTDGKELILANSADLSLKGAAEEILPRGEPISNIERFVFGIERRFAVQFSGTVRGSANPRLGARDFRTHCIFESKL